MSASAFVNLPFFCMYTYLCVSRVLISEEDERDEYLRRYNRKKVSRSDSVLSSPWAVPMTGTCFFFLFPFFSFFSFVCECGLTLEECGITAVVGCEFQRCVSVSVICLSWLQFVYLYVYCLFFYVGLVRLGTSYLFLDRNWFLGLAIGQGDQSYICLSFSHSFLSSLLFPLFPCTAYPIPIYLPLLYPPLHFLFLPFPSLY